MSASALLREVWRVLAKCHDLRNRGAYEGDLDIDDLVLAYATFGQFSPARDNVILVPTWYSGTHGIMSQTYIGPGHALDPGRYCIIVVNQIGSGLSTSPHHGLAAAFPRVRIGDDVGDRVDRAARGASIHAGDSRREG
mgnify:CR=1 FL=1